MSLPLIFTVLILFAIASGLIILITKTVKNNTAKILLSIGVVVIFGIGILFSIAIFGFISIGQNLSNDFFKAREEVINENEELIPQSVETGEQKDLFEMNEKIRGNNIEFEVLRVETEINDTFSESEQYCKLYFEVKNLSKEEMELFPSQMTLKDGGSELVYNKYGLENSIELFDSNLFLDPDQTITKFFPFDCQKNLEPYTLRVEFGNSGNVFEDVFFGGTDFEGMEPIEVKITLPENAD